MELDCNHPGATMQGFPTLLAGERTKRGRQNKVRTVGKFESIQVLAKAAHTSHPAQGTETILPLLAFHKHTRCEELGAGIPRELRAWQGGHTQSHLSDSRDGTTQGTS